MNDDDVIPTSYEHWRHGHGWCLPRPVRRFGGRLMEQQFWCWGRDVEHPAGNLLMRFGFERHRDRGLGDRSTCYRLDRDQLHISLWGFGMFFGRRDLSPGSTLADFGGRLSTHRVTTRIRCPSDRLKLGTQVKSERGWRGPDEPEGSRPTHPAASDTIGQLLGRNSV